MINRKKIHFILIFTISLIIQSCDDDWVFNVPEMPDFFIIDAHDYNNWIYYDLNNDLIVDISDEEALTSLEWHMAFQRNHIKLNGGLSHIDDNDTEIYFSDTLWPDFNEESINQAIVDFNLRKRTYGKIN